MSNVRTISVEIQIDEYKYNQDKKYFNTINSKSPTVTLDRFRYLHNVISKIDSDISD